MEPSPQAAPLPMPHRTPEPGPTLAPDPRANPAPHPAPEATAGPLTLAGLGHPVASVEIIGHPVGDSGPVGALHLAEVITYRDGTKPAIVGFDPEGRGLAHGGDRLFVETSLGTETSAEYIAAGREHYSLKIEPTAHQSLDHFVKAQAEAWHAYNHGKGIPAYDFAGNDTMLHNSNGAMVSSIDYAGRPDVAARLKADLEPPNRMRELEQGPEILSSEAAAMRLTLERRAAGLPSAPGASHELSRAQTVGLATPEPKAVAAAVGDREFTAIL
ncbi:MAG: hypothetical protein IAI50_02245, partial [Candidatus Eremiobacteraeota bacterium]|nr:hypothetical protein [Candidatus Eremiobacteraeota bacterium]